MSRFSRCLCGARMALCGGVAMREGLALGSTSGRGCVDWMLARNLAHIACVCRRRCESCSVKSTCARHDYMRAACV